MDLKLNDKVALITGASRGIGLAIARRLRDEGCHLHLVSINEASLAQAVDQLKSNKGGRVQAHAADLARPDEVERFASVLEDVDILVNNAGAIPLGSLTDVDDATWRRAWDLKVFGYINFTRSALLAWKRLGRRGVVVNIIGHAGENLSASYIAGTSGCAALMAFTRSVGSVTPRDSVRVVGINPGPVLTDRLLSALQARAMALLGNGARWAEITRDMPFGRAGHPSEIADAVAFLASDVSAYTTGTILTIDGGVSSGAKTFL